MKNMKVYPLGTVVRTTGKERYMLTGYVRLARDGSLAEYAAVRFPQGNIGINSFYYFNSDDITEVLYEGYKDESFEQIVQVIHAAAEGIEELATSLKQKAAAKDRPISILE